MAGPTSKQRMALAAAAAALIAAPFEGLRQYAYRDPVGIPTICFGSTRGVKMGDFKTIDECKALLTREMAEAISTVERCAPGLPVNPLAAFASATFNVGPRLVCDPRQSTAARLLREGRVQEACDQLLRWNRAGGVVLPGLVKRRAAERDLCRDEA